MNEKEEFLQKLRKMPVEELLKYESAAKFTNGAVGVIAVSLILLAMYIPNIIFIVMTSITVYVLANVSAGISDFIKAVQAQLEAKDK